MTAVCHEALAAVAADRRGFSDAHKFTRANDFMDLTPPLRNFFGP
jgi:hypothetical protein